MSKMGNGNNDYELRAYLNEELYKRFREIAEFLGHKDIGNTDGIRLMIQKFPLDKLREASKRAVDALL